MAFNDMIQTLTQVSIYYTCILTLTLASIHYTCILTLTLVGIFGNQNTLFIYSVVRYTAMNMVIIYCMHTVELVVKPTSSLT